MPNLLATAKHLFKSADLFLEKLSKPNTKYFSDKIDHDIAHSRNKTLLAISLTLLMIFFADTVLARASATTGLAICFFNITTCAVLILSCRYHPNIYKCYHTFLCIVYGPIIMNRGEESIHRAWFSAMTLPLFSYLFTGSLKVLIFQAGIQLIYLNKFYQSAMEKILMFATPESLLKSLTHSTNLAILYNIIVVVLLHCFMQKAYRRIAAIEQKKNEVENQKVFLLGFSHELRNLINSLTGNVKLASFENLTQRGKALLLNAEVCGELLLHLVNNILDTGKVEIGELEINPVPTRVYDTLEKIWGVCSELIRKKNLTGQMRIPKDLPKNIVMDHYRLTQIFLNLVGNAVKFTERGSVDLSIEWISHSEEVDETCFQPYPFNYNDDHDEGLFEKEKTLGKLDKNTLSLDLFSHKIEPCLLKQPTLTQRKGVLKVCISDTGCGMLKEETEKLFQKFTQVSSDPAKRKLGTGLGLFITRQLCQKMGGEVRVYSQVNVGSSFIFCIPANVVLVREESVHLRDTESVKKFIARQNLKAMIVDDIPFNCTILKSFFEKLGITVIGMAKNGLEAYQSYLEHVERGDCPQIITMDLDMPIMNGKDAASKIRQVEVEKGLEPCFMPIISGNCSESEISECLSVIGAIRANEFIKKPATFEELLRVIGNHFVQLHNKNRVIQS